MPIIRTTNICHCVWLLTWLLTGIAGRPHGLGSSAEDLDGGPETHSGRPTLCCNYLRFAHCPSLAFPRANKSKQTVVIRGNLGLKWALTDDLTNSCPLLSHGSYRPTPQGHSTLVLWLVSVPASGVWSLCTIPDSPECKCRSRWSSEVLTADPLLDSCDGERDLLN